MSQCPILPSFAVLITWTYLKMLSGIMVGHNQGKSEITSRRFKEWRSDCWCRCHADQWMAGWVCSTRVDSVCEDWLNKATDEAIVTVGTWCECMTGSWLASMTGRHCGKPLGCDLPSCGAHISWSTEMSIGIVQLIERSLGNHYYNIYACCSIWSAFVQLTWQPCSL